MRVRCLLLANAHESLINHECPAKTYKRLKLFIRESVDDLLLLVVIDLFLPIGHDLELKLHILIYRQVLPFSYVIDCPKILSAVIRR